MTLRTTPYNDTHSLEVINDRVLGHCLSRSSAANRSLSPNFLFLTLAASAFFPIRFLGSSFLHRIDITLCCGSQVR